LLFEKLLREASQAWVFQALLVRPLLRFLASLDASAKYIITACQ